MMDKHLRRKIDLFDPFPYELPPMLSAEEEQELGRRSLAGDIDARNRLVLANLRIAMKFARRFSNDAVPVEDLIHIGAMQLMRGAELWDPDREDSPKKLITYVWKYLKRRILTKAFDSPAGIHIPDNVREKLHAMACEQQRSDGSPLETRGEYLQKIEPLSVGAAYLDSTRAGLRVLQGQQHQVVTEPVDFRTQDSHEVVERTEFEQWLLKTLDDRAAQIIRWRFGFGPEHEELTHLQIGKRLGVTRARIQQLERRALNKLRKRLLLIGPYAEQYSDHVPVRSRHAPPLRSADKLQRLRHRALALVAQGESPRAVAQIIGCGRTTVYDWVKRAREARRAG